MIVPEIFIFVIFASINIRIVDGNDLPQHILYLLDDIWQMATYAKIESDGKDFFKITRFF